MGGAHSRVKSHVTEMLRIYLPHWKIISSIHSLLSTAAFIHCYICAQHCLYSFTYWNHKQRFNIAFCAGRQRAWKRIVNSPGKLEIETNRSEHRTRQQRQFFCRLHFPFFSSDSSKDLWPCCDTLDGPLDVASSIFGNVPDSPQPADLIWHSTHKSTPESHFRNKRSIRKSRERLIPRLDL